MALILKNYIERDLSLIEMQGNIESNTVCNRFNKRGHNINIAIDAEGRGVDIDGPFLGTYLPNWVFQFL